MTRTAVVTGGGTGIGRAMAAALIESGHDVVITGRRADVLERTAKDLGSAVRPVAFDAGDVDAITGALGELPESIDVLVNNAGGSVSWRKEFGDDLHAVRDLWLADFHQNVLTSVLLSTALADRIADNGRVINFGSIAAPRGNGSYGAAKAALVAWTVNLARDLGNRGITANLISPGYIEDTEFFAGKMTRQRREWQIGQ
ncbi:MAG: SDR family oxidoreductase, partial [Sciscionella sp.]|nr:SDR family oxidoreductase [Sciscionella sp.]